MTCKRMAMVWAWLAIGVALSASGLAQAARAGETVYTGLARAEMPPGDPTNWLDGANWSAGVPGPGDVATIKSYPYGNGFVVNVPSGVSLAGLNLTGASLLLGGSITVTGGEPGAMAS